MKFKPIPKMSTIRDVSACCVRSGDSTEFLVCFLQKEKHHFCTSCNFHFLKCKLGTREGWKRNTLMGSNTFNLNSLFSCKVTIPKINIHRPAGILLNACYVSSVDSTELLVCFLHKEKHNFCNICRE